MATVATRQQLDTAARVLQPQLAATPQPSLEQVAAAARVAGISGYGRWHLDRILTRARILDAEALVAELRARS